MYILQYGFRLPLSLCRAMPRCAVCCSYCHSFLHFCFFRFVSFRHATHFGNHAYTHQSFNILTPDDNISTTFGQHTLTAAACNKTFVRVKMYLHISQNEVSTYGFETPRKSACRHLWRCCVEHHAFFRLVRVSPIQSHEAELFSLGSRFRYRYVNCKSIYGAKFILVVRE